MNVYLTEVSIYLVNICFANNISNVEKIYFKVLNSRILKESFTCSLFLGLIIVIHSTFVLHQSSIQHFLVAQNAAANLLSGRVRQEHITPVLAALHWLLVLHRIRFKIPLLCFNAYLTEDLRRHTPTRALTSSQHLLVAPFSILKSKGERTFSICAPEF